MKDIDPLKLIESLQNAVAKLDSDLSGTARAMAIDVDAVKKRVGGLAAGVKQVHTSMQAFSNRLTHVENFLKSVSAAPASRPQPKQPQSSAAAGGRAVATAASPSPRPLEDDSAPQLERVQPEMSEYDQEDLEH